MDYEDMMVDMKHYTFEPIEEKLAISRQRDKEGNVIDADELLEMIANKYEL